MNTDNGMNERFKQVRLRLNMSQEEFGKCIGLSKSGVSNIENGERGLRDTYINAICNQFSINAYWLRTGSGEVLLSDSVTSYESFENYIKSIGYSLQVFTSQDGSDSLIELSYNGKKETTFTIAEFEEFQREIKNSVKYQIWKKEHSE